MKIIGIDPGYDRLGWAVGQVSPTGQVTIIQYGCIVTKKTEPIFQRYQSLIAQLESILTQHQPNEAAVETLFFSKNTSTALRVSEARGVIISALLSQSCAVYEYNPMSIKQAVTGTGSADKAAVTKMVMLQLKLGAAAKTELDDTMDALAILLTHATQMNSRKLTG